MNIFRAARHFDHLLCQDAYGVGAGFRAQMDVYDDSTRDGFGSVRRILSTSPDSVLPARGAVAVAGGKVWLLGESHPDYFGGREIRVKYTLHQADGVAHLRTFADWLGDSPGYVAYAARAYIRSDKEVEHSSEFYNVYELFFARGEAGNLPDPGVMTLEGQDFILHDPYFTEGGFLGARAIFLPEPRATAQLARRQYDPVTDAWEGEVAEFDVLSIRWQEYFHYFARYSEKYAPGDRQFIVRKEDAPTLSSTDHLTVGGREFALAAVQDEGTVWSAHGRPL
jgi:hypothetical protein